MKTKLLFVFGTRPEAIKMAPLYHRFKNDQNSFDTLLCISGQHREMLDQVLRIFNIVPDFDLNIMKPNQDLFTLTSNVLLGMREVIKSVSPDYIFVHGDTTTMFASSLAAYYENCKIVHIESGLRTFDIYSPFPEEANRQLVSRIAYLHFSPTERSKLNLIKEGIDDSKIIVSGNTVIDSLFWVLNKISSDYFVKNNILNIINSNLKFNWQKNRFILITGHRRENFGNSFIQICEAIRELAFSFPEIHFVYPVHLNPSVQSPVYTILSDIVNVHLIPPLDYEPFVYLLKHSFLVLTDSGGIQEEAPSLGKPVLVMRQTTERPEAVLSGNVRLVGSDKSRIIEWVSKLIESETEYSAMSNSVNPYGNGNASEIIYKKVKSLKNV